MVSNLNRILDEIRKEAHQIALPGELEPEVAVKLIMNIVELEDQNRVKAESRINQRVKGMIEDAARAGAATEDA